MMSLGVSKGGVIPPTDEDRRRIIKQMKVRTTLKGDKSWIHHHNSDSEDEKKSSPLSGRVGGGSPASTPIAPQSDRSSASKPQSGYLIRGVFTRTIDKTSSVPDSSSSNKAQKSSAAKGHSLGRLPSGYRMTTEDYKKLAPYNVKQKSVDLDEEDVPFSPDEHKKRTEAANSVLRRTASRERAYVLSAAKKSNGSPTQEFPPLFAKRIEIEEEEGQQRRSPTVSGSYRFTPDDNSTNGLRKTSTGSSWNGLKATAVSPSSPETGSKSQTTTSLTETSERIFTSTEIRNGENRQAPNGKSSSETVSQHEDGDKPLKEKSESFPWDELAPRETVVSTNGRESAPSLEKILSFTNQERLQTAKSGGCAPVQPEKVEVREERQKRSYPEHTEANDGFYPPKDRPADATDELHHQYETSRCLDDAKSEHARSSLQSDAPFPPTERAPVHLEDTEYSFKRSVLGYEERSSPQESRYTSPEVPAYSKPYWNEATSSQDLKEGNTPRESGHESAWASDDYKAEPTPGGFTDSNDRTEKGQEPPDHDVHPEPPRSKEHTEHEPSMTQSTDVNKGMSPCVQSEEVTSRRSSSLPRESSIAAPETRCASESDPSWERITPGFEEQTHPTTESYRESPRDWRHNEPNPVAASRSNFSSKDSALSAYETQHPTPLHMEHQPFHTGVSAPSHRIPSYVDSQVFSSSRSYDSLPRDTTTSQRSHRVPFYMDSLNYNSTRLLSGSSERICSPVATLPHSSPAASGYQPDSSTAGKGVLFVKEYVNSSELSASPRYGSGSLVDLTNLERAPYSHHSYLSGAPMQRSSEPVCSYCSREIRDCPKIIIEHLNICCHEYCFRCGICHKAMGDLLDKIFIHRDIVHCDKCYQKLF
ncbi:zinc finger protein 185 isoform X4 [Caloenas nicobarica]|uniref:zinc finger protein 185 isoform X4 n=1 Tax=Caloenas nicobarica TaxID=187106 RepID=UPI0032B80968